MTKHINIDTPDKRVDAECDCCGWDDMRNTHEPYCAALTEAHINIEKQQLADHLNTVIDIWFTLNENNMNRYSVESLKETLQITIKHY